MKPSFSVLIKHLTLLGTVAGLLFAGMISGRSQGIGLLLTTNAYTTLQGGSISCALTMVPVYDYYDCDLNDVTEPYTSYDLDTGDTWLTDWYVHGYYVLPTIVQFSGSGITTINENVDWPSNYYGNESFTVEFPANDSVGPDLTGTVSYLDLDPYPDDENPYWDYCYWYYCSPQYPNIYNTNTASLTLLNPN